MDFLEKDLEEIIYTADRKELEERGLEINGKLLRQVRIGNYGIADLISVERVLDFSYYERTKKYKCNLFITVYELKRDKIGLSAFLQATRYARGIQRYLQKRNFAFNVCFKLVLIGSKVEESDLVYLGDINTSSTGEYFEELGLTFYTYNYSLSGLEFTNKSTYMLSEEGF